MLGQSVSSCLASQSVRAWPVSQSVLGQSVSQSLIFIYFAGIAPHRLSGLKIGDLNAETHRQLCRKLNIDVSDKDWRTLAGRMKYTTQQVKEFARDANPADKLLDYWSIGEGHDVACLIELVKGMNRNDLVELLESEPNPTTFYLWQMEGFECFLRYCSL